jgi:hypothetical protein
MPSGGSNAAYWNANVQNRMILLVQQMGKQLDHYPNLEAVNFDEPAPGIHDPVWISNHLNDYLNGMMNVVLAAKAAFPHTVVLQYINWPVQPIPGMIAQFKTAGIGVGGPDVFVNDEGLINGSYPYIKSVSGVLPIGMAVQYGDYSQKSGNGQIDPPGIPALYHFAQQELKANYIFWMRRTKEPWNGSDYHQDLKNYLGTINWAVDPAGGLNTACPAMLKNCVN